MVDRSRWLTCWSDKPELSAHCWLVNGMSETNLLAIIMQIIKSCWQDTSRVSTWGAGLNDRTDGEWNGNNSEWLMVALLYAYTCSFQRMD